MPSTTTVKRVPSLDELIERHRGKKGGLLSLLENAQELERFRYLPEATLRSIAEGMGIPLSQVYSVATFYSFFNLKPQGLHSIVVCRGTACHTRGSLELLQGALKKLGIEGYREEEESSATTADNFCSVRTVACFGQCALAPVVQIDGTIYSRMTVGKLVAAIEKLRKGGKE
ncbi:MAG TPA: NAD(P)H-dependent oxidoreductase subunit E [Spirochaetales bacterium]|nr:NAD(P)H-dependent oxidoreductase subunit E [Spirochaetales bacterium]HRY56105.1 NAD(P)H-dependent oxidoreductase subunit E [Spirochaetia bacterium]HRZ63515.1 NAD(P)H-dependent oxidoreductase subunit E [Spirochaetia bacterium]